MLMLEKLKDILYEFSDVLLAIIIILLLSTIITWKITDSLAYSKEKNFLFKQNSIHQKSEKHSKKSNATTSVKKTESNEKQKNIQNKPSAATVQVIIDSGTPGEDIAEILKRQNLIKDTHTFIARIEQRQLASKLKFGTFEIKTGSSLDEIINIITKQN